MINTKFLFRNLIVLLLGVLVFAACNLKDKIETEKVETKSFSLEAPKDMEKTNGLNDLATLQYQNVQNDLYFIVLEEEKSGFHNAVKQGFYDIAPNLNGYYQVVKSHFSEITADLKVSDVKAIRVNSSPAIVFSMSGNSIEFKKDVFYRYAVIEDDNNYYQIMGWTNPAFKQQLADKLDGVIASFKSKSISKTNTSKWQKKNQN